MWLSVTLPERTILLREILLECKFENNFVETLKIMSNTAKNFDIEFERST